MRPVITVVGSINMDLVFRTPRMPAVGETIGGHGFRQVPGGKGANQAVAAARQGAAVNFVGTVGADAFGEFALGGMMAEHINIHHVERVPAAASGVAGIFVDDSGANSIVFAPGANELLTVEHVQAATAAIADAEYLICQLESPLPTVVEAMQIARRHGVKVVFNPAPARTLDDALLGLVDVLVLNETEAGQLAGIDVADAASAAQAARVLRARGAGVVLLTMGEQGVMVADGSERMLPAVRVDAVDTTAAGDTFVGACAVALARGVSLDQAVDEAQHAAALAVTRIGAQTSIPTREEVQGFMNSSQARRNA
ncbi:MAG: ribokinase [Telluria sp.]